MYICNVKVLESYKSFVPQFHTGSLFSAALQAAAADMKQADRGFKTAMDEEVANNLGKVVGEFAGCLGKFEIGK